MPELSTEAGRDFSPLVLADRLLTLAQDADRAGYSRPAERLMRLAFSVCGVPAKPSP